MMSAELVALIQEIAREKNLSIEEVLEAMCEGVRVAYERQFMRSIPKKQRKKQRPKIIAILDLDNKRLRIVLEKTVVEQPTNAHLEISLKEARQIAPNAQLGDKVQVDLPLREFSRTAMQTARQEMLQRIRMIEQQQVYDFYKDKIGTVITGQVLREDSYGNIYLAIERGEALLPRKERILTENLQKGERVRVLLYELKKPTGGVDPIVFVSRTHRDLLRRLLEMEVPEIQKGIVEIRGLVRDPGSRSKVAVASKDPNVDPAGACIGEGGKRINSITQELRNEKVDIIPWSPDEAEFLVRALSPAKVLTVIMNYDERTVTAIVTEDQLSLAIGRQGRNVSLAAKLTGWRVDIRSPERLSERVVEEEVSQTPPPPGLEGETPKTPSEPLPSEVQGNHEEGGDATAREEGRQL